MTRSLLDALGFCLGGSYLGELHLRGSNTLGFELSHPGSFRGNAGSLRQRGGFRRCLLTLLLPPGFFQLCQAHAFLLRALGGKSLFFGLLCHKSGCALACSGLRLRLGRHLGRHLGRLLLTLRILGGHSRQQAVHARLGQLTGTATGILPDEPGQHLRVGRTLDAQPGSHLLLEQLVAVGFTELVRNQRKQVKILLQRGALPWDLSTPGGQSHTQPNALECVFKSGTGNCKLFQQVPGVETISSFTVLSHRTRRRCIGQQTADRRIKLTQAFGSGPEVARKRIITTGIQHNQKAAVRGLLHVTQQVAYVHRLPGHICCRADIGCDRNHVVAPVLLQAVAGIIKQSELDLGVTDGLTEAVHCRLQLAQVGIELFIDDKPRLAKQIGHRIGIIARVGEGGGSIT